MMKFLIIHIILACCLFGILVTPTFETEPPQVVSEYVERYFKIPVFANKKQQMCLTEALYYEAGNQSAHGKEAVALVIMNRVGKKGYGKTICGVVRQAHVVNERKICQFSYWCFAKTKPNKVQWEESKMIAKRVLQNQWRRDILFQFNDAIYFHATYVRPVWSKHKVKVGKIGTHIFYRE